MLRVLAFLAIICCGAVFASDQPSQTTHKEHVKNCAPSKQNNSIPSIAISQVPSSGVITSPVESPINKCQSATQNCQPKKNWFDRFLEDPIATFTGLLFAATVALWIATRRLVTGTENALITSNRPWVMAESVEHLEPFPNMETCCRIGYKVCIRNSGNSVAKSVIFNSRTLKFPPTLDWLAERVGDLSTETIKLWSSKRPINLPIGITLAPGQTISPIRCPTYSDGNDPTDEQITNGAFLIVGYIQYVDQFDLMHHTRFAFTPDADSVRPWNGKSFAIYNDYQDAD